MVKGHFEAQPLRCSRAKDCRIPASVQKPLLSATAGRAALALEPRGSANILRALWRNREYTSFKCLGAGVG